MLHVVGATDKYAFIASSVDLDFYFYFNSISISISFIFYSIRLFQVRKLGMMAGGTGITPMLQIISAVMREAGGMGRSRMEMSLIFANKSEDDILLRDMIEKLVR